MVRTKTRARTLSEKWQKDKYPNGPPNIVLPPALQRINNNLIFKDHTGKPALMSWWSGGSKRSLPPLPSWVFYMIHPDVPHDFDGCVFRDSLEQAHGLDSSYDREHRYEFFFLPGATAEECHAHYLKEMEARGTIWRQIRNVKKAVKDMKQREELEVKTAHMAMSTPAQESTSVREPASDEESASDQDTNADNQHPGLVWTKRDRDIRDIWYRGWFFMYPDAEVKFKGAAGEVHDVYLVRFDPLLVDPEDWSEEDLARFNPMEHPIYSERMEAEGPETESTLSYWMGRSRHSHWVQKANEATENAVKLGWESW
ncbi:hypothetical protein B0J13DRAFT_442061 [Dactylonectria estremocensis]|uniref:Uncharacterized protein n=1 Tax=Dactylonectria estremocensis TaxID=1079267 RepID=A0A9P9EXQ7_9HYPO|nr:hypothetical protein B0J13DRAFT_442061 [Dactylonectria estremocensis]